MNHLDLRDRLQTHLEHVARERDPYLATAGHFFVQTYIQTQLAQWGPVTTFEFKRPQGTHTNLILALPGRSPSQTDPILIGAHYDAVPGSPGADDNATGVAVLLELARAIALAPANYPVWFVAFDLEEHGMVGSAQYAQQLKQQGQALRLMLSLEMLGYCTQAPNSQNYPTALLKRIYPTQGNFIALIGNLTTIPDLHHLSRACHQAGVPSRWLPAGWRGEVVPAVRLSDHSSFWDQGYRALMVTDTAFLRNPHYHQASDRIETLDLDFLTHICVGLLQGIQSLR